VLTDLLLRFVFGGIIVSCFALLGDALRPRSFAGLFNAAPSVALASLVLTAHSKGLGPITIEARTMIAAVLAFFATACIVRFTLMRVNLRALTTALLTVLSWSVFAAALWLIGWR